ncbi:MAG: HIG1 domain-containing protein [Gammaproteobacteria bacterium]|nr:HIG1 domain-containing protein [Gammaproteobacteria bacterium]
MSVITLFVIIAFLGTIGMLVAGGMSMIKGGEYDLTHSAEFMEGRILLQAITLGLILIAVFAWS